MRASASVFTWCLRWCCVWLYEYFQRHACSKIDQREYSSVDWTMGHCSERRSHTLTNGHIHTTRPAIPDSRLKPFFDCSAHPFVPIHWHTQMIWSTENWIQFCCSPKFELFVFEVATLISSFILLLHRAIRHVSFDSKCNFRLCKVHSKHNWFSRRTFHAPNAIKILNYCCRAAKFGISDQSDTFLWF